MNKFLLFVLATFFCCSCLFAQSPLYIPYQAVARNAAGNLLVNQAVNLRFTVQQSTSGGSTLYQETQSTTTNSLGLFNVNIGNGTPTSGTFSGITWGDGQPKFMQVEIDPNGSGYVNMGSTQMMSVPYALYAGSAGSVGTIPTGTAGQTLYNNSGTWTATSNLYNNGTHVGIGTTNPSALFSVGSGNGAFTVDNSGDITTSGTITMSGSGSGSATIQPQATAGSFTYFLPNTAPSGVGDVLTVTNFTGGNTITLGWAPNSSTTCPTEPAPASFNADPLTICSGSTGNIYTIAEVTGANGYAWTVPTGAIITSGWGTNSIAVTMPGVSTATTGVVTCAATNNCNQPGTPLATPTITIYPVPTLGTISVNNASVCLNGTEPIVTFTNPQAYSVIMYYNIGGSGNYTITVPANNGTATVQVPTTGAGSFTYNLTSVANASDASCSSVISGQSATTKVNGLPTATITSPNISDECSGVTTAISGAIGNIGSDAWSLTLNNSGGTATGTGGTSWTQNVAPTATTTYSIASLTDEATGCAATSLTGSETVNIYGALGTAGSISGYTTVGYNQTASYTIAAVANATGYTWGLSGSVSQVSVSGTTLNVSFTGSQGVGGSATIKCTANGCTANSAAANYSVTVGGNYYSITANSAAVQFPTSAQITAGWGVTAYKVQLWGGGGSGGNAGGGGGGAYVEGNITATSVPQFNTWVGIGGAASQSGGAGGIGYASGGAAGLTSCTTCYNGGTAYGGGGAGATAIGVSGGVLAVAAGGGGGGGVEYSSNNHYPGGGGGNNTTTAGGGIDGVNGKTGNNDNTGNSAGGATSSTGGGLGGAKNWGSSGCTCTLGNAGTTGNSTTPGTGGPGNTGTAVSDGAGGGGGGGYYGGGGGAGASSTGWSDGGGGGGTSYPIALTSGLANTVGSVTFTQDGNSAAGNSGGSGNSLAGQPGGYGDTNYYGGTGGSTLPGYGGGGGTAPFIGNVGEIYISY